MPLLETTLAALVNQASAYLVAGVSPGRLGNDHPSLFPYGPLRCADRELVVGAGNDRQFTALAAVLALPLEPGWATNAGRVADRSRLRTALEQRLAGGTASHWSARLSAAGVPCAVVNDLPAAFADPQVSASDLVASVEHPAGPIRLVGSPYLVDGRRPAVRRAPATLGEHTGELLAALGLPDELVADLRTAGVVA